MLPSSYSELPRLAVHCSKVVFKKKKKKKKKKKTITLSPFGFGGREEDRGSEKEIYKKKLLVFDW